MVTVEALKHLKRRFEGRARVDVNTKDITSINVLIEFYQDAVKRNETNHDLFMKLFINEFLRQAVLYDKGSRVALKNIEDLLQMPLKDYYKCIADESTWKVFADIVREIEYIEPEDLSADIVQRKIQERHNQAVMAGNHQKLKDVLLNDRFSAEQAQNWLKHHVNEIIFEYSKWD